MIAENDFKTIMKIMGGSLISINPNIYAVWSRGCKDPTRFLFTYLGDGKSEFGTLFNNIRFKTKQDYFVIVTQNSIITKDRSYNFDVNSDSMKENILKLFIEMAKKYKNYRSSK